jgi:hypothetical protein
MTAPSLLFSGEELSEQKRRSRSSLWHWHVKTRKKMLELRIEVKESMSNVFMAMYTQNNPIHSNNPIQI